MSELNPFAVNRAEYMRDLWKYYVPLKELDLETSKALVIEGGRGTGKSTVFLCNCWRNQLAAAENDPAKTIDSFLNNTPMPAPFYQVIDNKMQLELKAMYY